MMNENNSSGGELLPAHTVNALTYHGTPIATRGEKLSLTDMWKAAGSPANQEPFNWTRFEGKSFVEAVALAHNLSETQVITTKRGKGGSTMAHWQIGLAYAKYLSHDFHMWCNQVVRDRMEGRALAASHGLAQHDIAIIGNVVKNSARVVIREQIAELVPQMLNDALAAIAAAATPAPQAFVPIIRKGRTAGQIWRSHGFTPMHATPWFGNRLTEMGCAIYGSGDPVIFAGGARLFDPDKASEWIVHGGGRALVEGYIKERLGQGKLEGV